MLRVRKSKIQGKGLFTDSPIPSRKKIGEFTGERISVREARRRAKGAKRIVIIELSSTKAIDGSVGGGPFEFVNHSCDPNVFVRIAYGRAEFYAQRDIRREKSSPATTANLTTTVNSHAVAARRSVPSSSDLRTPLPGSVSLRQKPAALSRRTSA